tara:strand:+ start:62 stop:400 length:339 start_codon:yes stop_codon:yes gene_type:complete
VGIGVGIVVGANVGIGVGVTVGVGNGVDVGITVGIGVGGNDNNLAYAVASESNLALASIVASILFSLLVITDSIVGTNPKSISESISSVHDIRINKINVKLIIKIFLKILNI